MTDDRVRGHPDHLVLILHTQAATLTTLTRNPVLLGLNLLHLVENAGIVLAANMVAHLITDPDVIGTEF